jgi:hypothetical protein
MPRLAIAFFLLTTGSAVAEPALMISCEDKIFAKDSTHDRLVAAFGKQNVALVSERVPSGTEVRSVIYPKDPKRKLTVTWDDGAARAIPRTLSIEKPSQWAAPRGVRIGTPLDELERLNGAPFTIAGFGRFAGGTIDWRDGGLLMQPGGCFIYGTMEPTVKLPKPQMDKISGIENYPSTHPLMRQAQPVMSELHVGFAAAR